MTTHEVEKTDDEWRQELSKEEYAVLRKAGTERAGTGPLLDEHRVGVYHCRACGNVLFRSETKFESHCGWPSFYDPTNSDAVELIEDRTFGMRRVEVRCKRCGSHLGHVFEDAPQTPTGEARKPHPETGKLYNHPGDLVRDIPARYCMNSISLTFEPVAE